MRFANKHRSVYRPQRRGFTLAEALLSATILAIVSASAALPFAAGIQQANEAARLEQAVELGQAMMEEVLARPFFEPGDRVANPGPELGEATRKMFTNIDDFHAFAEAAGQLRNFNNTAITDATLSGYRREVTVAYVTLPGLGQAGDDVDSFVHIQVRVYDGNALMVTLDRLAGRED
ncbi:MAG: type II secretion system protein [Planctomycetota bacterium]